MAAKDERLIDTDAAKHARFHLKTLEGLRRHLDALGENLPLSEDLSVLGASLELAGRTVPNRLGVHPMEGLDSLPNGAPGPLSFRRYLRYARGGFGLIWVESTAVLPEARSNPGQLWLHDGNVDAFRDLVQQIRETAVESFGREPVLVIQLTHSGRYSKPAGVPEPIIAHRSPILDPLHKLPDDYPVVSDDYLDRLQDTYVSAGRLAALAGFDGVDIKSCHCYLVSELLASHRRGGRYGGCYENRTRLLRETLTRIKADVSGFFVTTRMNAYDAIPYPYGFGVSRDDHRVPDLADPIRLAGELEELGVPVLNVSIGNPYYNPHYGRPYDRPVAGATPPDDHPLVGVCRFLGITRSIQESHPDLPVMGSGYTWLRHLLPYAAAGVISSGGAMLVGLGRGAFAYPDCVRDILEKGAMDPEKCCVACSACTQIMLDGGRTGCVVRDSEVYEPEYRMARRTIEHPTSIELKE